MGEGRRNRFVAVLITWRILQYKGLCGIYNPTGRSRGGDRETGKAVAIVAELRRQQRRCRCCSVGGVMKGRPKEAEEGSKESIQGLSEGQS